MKIALIIACIFDTGAYEDSCKGKYCKCIYVSGISCTVVRNNALITAVEEDNK